MQAISPVWSEVSFNLHLNQETHFLTIIGEGANVASG